MTAALAEILYPHTEEQFFGRYCGREFLHISGAEKRFMHLFPWTALNDILRHFQTDKRRIQLVKDGRAVPVESYLGVSPVGRTLLPACLNHHLRDGATLIINRVDEIYEPVTVLAEALEESFHVPINVNLYAAWTLSRGLDLHFDGHDVFVLQVVGTKRWQLHGFTETYPVHTFKGEQPPSTGCVWEGTLRSGDVLYIPRGMWHVAIPCDEPTLHLSIGAKKPTAMDILRWLSDELIQDERMRSDVPLPDDEVKCRDYLQILKQAIVGTLSNEDVLARFWRSMHSMIHPRPLFGFPEIVADRIIARSAARIIVFRLPYALNNVQESSATGDIEVLFGGKSFTYEAVTRPLFSWLTENSRASLAEFYDHFSDSYEPHLLKTFLADLVQAGLIVVVGP
jgi:hypothetical protein